ncbi:MAG: amino acid ABC transporter ATP-binding protein [Candidatus Borkfalkiaceae bacterium]|nr:amino acid ABC transporter ATP-binding protein [Christensenellaceae bacterium]
MSYFSIEGLTKNFGELGVLRGISLDLQKGEVLSIIGSSGSGKTTLLRCINFLETPSSGRITLDGEVMYSDEEIKRVPEKELRRRRMNFGLVFQSFNLFPQYNVLDNVKLAPTLFLKEKLKELKKSGTKKAEIDEFYREELAKIDSDAKQLIEKVGLTEKINAYPCELSGGQCQRVAIARALVLSPKILCFDEPTSALDPMLTGEVLKVIKSLRGEGRTMIIVTHEMDFAKNVSDKIAFMSEGVVAEYGTPDEVFNNSSSEELRRFLAAEKKEEINE